MDTNDFDTLAYKILQYLKECYENSKEATSRELNYQSLKVEEKQFYNTLKMLSDDDYISGFITEPTFDIVPAYNVYGMCITPKGLKFLENNSKMKKLYKTLKEVKFWLS